MWAGRGLLAEGAMTEADCDSLSYREVVVDVTAGADCLNFAVAVLCVCASVDDVAPNFVGFALYCCGSDCSCHFCFSLSLYPRGYLPLCDYSISYLLRFVNIFFKKSCELLQKFFRRCRIVKTFTSKETISMRTYVAFIGVPCNNMNNICCGM